MKYFLYCILAINLFWSSCIEPKHPYTSLAPGIWRGVLQLSQEPKIPLKDEIERFEKEGKWPIHEVENELPFMFEVKYENEKPIIELINASERIPLDEVYIAKNRTTADDTFYINIPVFDAHIKGILKGGILQGTYTVRSKINYSMPFAAHFGKGDRFAVLPATPTIDLSGLWSCKFNINEKNPYPAIGEFKQEGSKLTGTFRTETGDYRFLDGTVTGDKFYLSAFDGAHAFLFYGKAAGDSLIGTFKSGTTSIELWSAVRNANAQLKSSMALNKGTDKPVAFSFQNQDGTIKTLNDFKADVTILQIMGTWCPNCWDETKFLTEYLKNNSDKNIKVAALACERYRDTAKALNSIKNYKNKMNIPYDILLASTSTNKAETSKQLPFIDTILSYPTMVILDRNQKIHTIHTGFDGPATSKYAAFKSEFDNKIKSILNINQ